MYPDIDRGVDEHGRKELILIEDGYRESTQSWTELPEGLHQRGLTIAPRLGLVMVHWGSGKH